MSKIVFGITQEDVNAIALDLYGRELTEEEMQKFESKFTIYDWSDDVECYLEEVVGE